MPSDKIFPLDARRVKIALGAIGADDGNISAANPMPVAVVSGGSGGGPATIADGADVAQGATTNAPFAGAEDATARTHTSLLKGIKNALGLISDAAVVTDANGTIQQYLRGLVKMLAGGVATLLNVVGNVAAGVADSGNPVKVGGKYNATPPVLDDGDRGDLQLDSASNQIVNPMGLDPVDDGIGASRARSFSIDVGTSGAYLAGDAVGVGGPLSLATANFSSGRRVKLKKLSVAVATAVAPALRFYLFKVTPSGGNYTDNALLDFSVADSARKVGVVDVQASDYLTNDGQTFAVISNIDQEMAVSGTTLFMVISSEAAQTINNGDLHLEIELEQQ